MHQASTVPEENQRKVVDMSGDIYSLCKKNGGDTSFCLFIYECIFSNENIEHPLDPFAG